MTDHDEGRLTKVYTVLKKKVGNPVLMTKESLVFAVVVAVTQSIAWLWQLVIIKWLDFKLCDFFLFFQIFFGSFFSLYIEN